MISYTRTVAPVAQPLTLDEVMLHLRITDVTEEPILDTYLRAAVEYMERTLGIRFLTQTWTATLDWMDVPCTELPLPGAPLASVTSISYVDTAGATQTWAGASYVVDTTARPGRVYPAYNTYWPEVRDQLKAMTVTYVCGYTAASLVPKPLQHALKLLIGHWYENREATLAGEVPQGIPIGYDALVAPYRVWTL